MSYGLYLWHWPVFVIMTPDRVGLDGAELAAARMAVAFVVATVSYFLIEQPIRRHGLRGAAGRLRRVGLRVHPAAIAAVLVLVVLVVVRTSTGTLASDPAAGWTPMIVPAHGEPVPTTSIPPGYVLPGIPEDRPLRLVVAGDSVAWSIGYPWENGRAERPDSVADLRIVANLGCTITPGVPIVEGVEWPPVLCPDWPRAWETTAFGFQPDVMLVMWGAWEVYDHRVGDEVLVAGTPEYGLAYEQGMAESIDLVTSVAPATRLVYATVTCMHEAGLALGGESSPRNDPERLAWVNERTARVAAGHPGRILVVDLDPLLCPGGEPIDRIDGMDPREDGVHFTPEFSPTVWAYIEAQVRPWLAVPAPVGSG